MDDNDDVLGNFKGLSGANLLKNYKANVKRLNATVNEASSPASPCSELLSILDSDIDSPFGQSKSKALKKSSSKKVKSPIKKNIATKSLPKTRKSLTSRPVPSTSKTTKHAILEIPDDSPVAKRTRRSLSVASSNGSLCATNSSELNMDADASLDDVANTTAEIRKIIEKSNKVSQRAAKKTSSRRAGAAESPSLATLVAEALAERSARTGRGRRRSRTTRASKAPIVDCVDLSSTPPPARSRARASAPATAPRVTGFISIDADSDDDLQAAEILINSKKIPLEEENFDIENPIMNVKIIWNGKPEVFKLRKYQKFSSIFQDLATRENADIASITLNSDDKIIAFNDTPASIDYKLYQFLQGRVMQKPLSKMATKKHRSANAITLKVQSDKWKQPLRVGIEKDEKLKILFIKCAEELKISPESFKISFDGEYVNPNDTPMDLEMEGGEILEIRFN